jgi:O-acetyl-ADP-ribose deacetylase
LLAIRVEPSQLNEVAPMRRKFVSRILELSQGEITRERVDVIVNAANSALAGGGGVDGAIHRSAGPSIMAETRSRYPDGCPTGRAVITAAGDLPVRYIIHAVGPVWRGGLSGEADQLAGAYRRSLELADEHNCKSIVFPALSTGAYGYPMDLASRIALRTIIDFLDRPSSFELVRFVLFSTGAYGAFAAALEELTS